MILNDLIPLIKEADENITNSAKKRWDSIAKPVGSLGKLEDAITKIAAAKGNERELSIEKKALLVFCADNGVVEEGVTQNGSFVTRIMTENFPKGKTCVSTMAKTAGVDVYTIDIGLYGEKYPYKEICTTEVIDKRVGNGAGNIAKEPAMSPFQCEQAVLTGIELVKTLKEDGYGILLTGEMGIGNTTPTSALTAVLLNKTIEEVTGRGAGLSNNGFEKKKEILERIIKRHKSNHLTTPLDILADIGSYDIAGMVGAFLGGGIYGVPVMIDGVISSVAAFIADRLNPNVKDYMLASHLSEEPSAKYLQDALHLEPILHGNFRLGEGSGAVAFVPLLDMAAKVYETMITFDDLKI